MLYIVFLGGSDYGVYSTTSRNEYGTGLMFRGSLEMAISYKRTNA